MAAFDRISSGIRDLDAALDNIRLGDNVVLRVSDLDEFHLFLDPFVARCRKDGRKLVYVRFASHPPLVAEEAGVETVHMELSHRFETFTVAIHQLIRERGREVFYVFDCLSELQTIWATDMMMSNFFRVTCPFLFEMDFVDPVKYYLLPYTEKPAVRDVIHRVNWRLRGKGVRMVLLVHGTPGGSAPAPRSSVSRRSSPTSRSSMSSWRSQAAGRGITRSSPTGATSSRTSWRQGSATRRSLRMHTRFLTTRSASCA